MIWGYPYFRKLPYIYIYICRLVICSEDICSSNMKIEFYHGLSLYIYIHIVILTMFDYCKKSHSHSSNLICEVMRPWQVQWFVLQMHDQFRNLCTIWKRGQGMEPRLPGTCGLLSWWVSQWGVQDSIDFICLHRLNNGRWFRSVFERSENGTFVD